ncbi:MAG: SOS response-associated peptidase [Candidatus Nanopelagicales bacterium]|nr:SOS response-associated peptidase [Candidatus Nanopelagicales bacterium]
MCGRFTLKTDPKVIASQFKVSAIAVLEGRIADLTTPTIPAGQIDSAIFGPNFNVAPTHQIPAVLSREDETLLAAFTWGLVPTWAKDPAIGARMINARSETAAEKPSFRSALVKRRCIVPADGWYEWQGSPGKKTPYYFSAPNESVLGLAGIYESWKQPDGQLLWSAAILTQEARSDFSYIHDRMPVLVTPELQDLWLKSPTNPLNDVLDVAPSIDIQTWEVSPAVGNVRNNSADLITNQTLF